jgi:hypothetical protein
MTCRNGLKYWRPAGSGSPLRAGRRKDEPGGGELVLEVAAVVALVADDDLPGSPCQVVVGQDAQQDLPLVGLRPGQGEADGQAVQGAQQVQPQSPEPSRVGGAVPVLGPSGQVRALDGLAGAGALDGGGVHDPDVVGPQAGAGGQDAGAVWISPRAARSRLL